MHWKLVASHFTLKSTDFFFYSALDAIKPPTDFRNLKYLSEEDTSANRSHQSACSSPPTPYDSSRLVPPLVHSALGDTWPDHFSRVGDGPVNDEVSKGSHLKLMKKGWLFPPIFKGKIFRDFLADQILLKGYQLLKAGALSLDSHIFSKLSGSTYNEEINKFH